MLKEIHECTAVGERGSEMAHLGDAVAAYRAALRGGIVAVSLATGSAQRQPYFACSVARYRARDAAEQPAPVIRYRRPKDRRTRPNVGVTPSPCCSPYR